MDKKKIGIIAVILILLLGLGVATKLLFLDRQDDSISALRVDSAPSANLYVNNQIVGKTPYDNEKMLPGEYLIKLVATGVSGTFYPWETKIKLTKDSLTYVSRDIGSTEENSGDQILWLDKLSSDGSAELAVVSDPDGAEITVDGVQKATASTILKDISIGDHTIIVSIPGFSDQIIKARIKPGFRVNAAVKLARLEKDVNTASQSAVASSSAAVTTATSSAKTDTFPKPYALVLETGTGFLRVHTSPALNATESARVKPGEKYPLLSELSGWAQIKLASTSGWVTDQFVQKFK